ncbi:DNA cytosine methyltransferase [Nonomuraea typhae]|uniref:DNA cytosine methyltransferase n=1 Tax=Nonomuraea typhae TaxID=2603600 RepID=UPI0012FC60E9|nr:DNA cytosine methyltransferase [Nonomuraea typhae]
MILNLFAGPGGVDHGARILGMTTPIRGYDIDADACATATAAGFQRTLASVTDLDPEAFRGVTVAVPTPPCPPFSRSGLGKGLEDFHAVRAALTLLGDFFAGMVSADAYKQALDNLQDERSALVVETLRFAFLLPDVRVVVAEQVPGAAPLWMEVGAELAAAADWTHLAVVDVASEDLGVASRRTRSFLIATRDYVPDLVGLPVRSLWSTGRFAPPMAELPPTGHYFPATTMAFALLWPKGEMVNTRGARKTSGGNLFSADQPAWCLTEKARTWYRVSDGLRLTGAEAGLLMGFPRDYPWQGSRSKRFLQAADAVSPIVAAAVLGATLGIDWEPAVREHLAGLYPAAEQPLADVQLDLFAGVA